MALMALIASNEFNTFIAHNKTYETKLVHLCKKNSTTLI